MRVVVVTPPAEVVSLDEAKRNAYVDHSDDDALIKSLVSAATANLDGPGGWLGRCLGQQRLCLTLDRFAGSDGGSCIRLPFGPVISVVSVVYTDTDGVQQTIAETEYRVIDGCLLAPVYGGKWPTARCDRDVIEINYVAGYATVPEELRVAIMMHVAHLYRNREAASDLNMAAVPFGYDRLVGPFRVWI